MDFVEPALSDGHSAIGRCFHGTKVLVEIFEVPDDGNHGGVVGGIAEFWDVNGPSVAAGVVAERLAETCIGADTSGYGYVLNLQVLGCTTEFVHQDIDNGPFQ